MQRASHRGVLIGCGFFAVNHMNAWKEIPGIEIVAVCDRDATKAKDFAERFNCKSFTDAEAMLREVEPDFVDVATTVASHRALVILAARYAKLVICQKPFAESLIDAEAMVQACEGSGAKLVVHENFRWQKPFRRIHELLNEGWIGSPQFLRLNFRHAFDIYAGQPYLAQVEDLALTDIGLHLFDLARFLFGDTTRVSCETQRLNPSVAGQDAFQALLRFENGAVGSIECSFFSHYAPDPFPQTLAVLEGTRGTIELKRGFTLQVTTDGAVTEENCEPAVPVWGGKPWHLVQESVQAFEAHVKDVLDGNAKPQPSGAHNLETLSLTLAAIESSKAHATLALTKTTQESRPRLARSG